MSETQKWPDVLWIVRHGQSAGNVARDQAEATGQAVIQLAARDMDVPLSTLGEQQADALGRWFGGMAESVRPTALITSPYLRARDTSQRILAGAGVAPDGLPFIIDERLREREFGILDGLTRLGIEQRFPDQARMRSALGKFYHRPPGGESWCDVILRLRSLIETITRDYRQERVLIVCHQVVVLCLRYLLERMTEEQILAIDSAQEIANCAVTSYVFDPNMGRAGKFALNLFNFVAPLEEGGTPITRRPDAPNAPK